MCLAGFNYLLTSECSLTRFQRHFQELKMLWVYLSIRNNNPSDIFARARLVQTRHVTEYSLVLSLNSPFFPPPIGAEPGRAKRESRISCMRMRMLRTKQSKITRVHTTLLASMCRVMPFSARALKKKHIFFDVDIVVKNKNVRMAMWFIVVCTLEHFFRIVSPC